MMIQFAQTNECEYYTFNVPHVIHCHEGSTNVTFYFTFVEFFVFIVVGFNPLGSICFGCPIDTCPSGSKLFAR